MTFDEKILSSKCREIIKTYDDVLKHFYEEIVRESNSVPINGTDAFSYAKETIRREAIREGAKMLIKRIETKANVRDQE